MTNKELKQQIAQLKARAKAIVQQQESRTNLSNARAFLDMIFGCADKPEVFLAYPSNPDYLVSSAGRIKSIKYNKELLLALNNDGKYLYVTMSIDGKRVNKKVHRMVAETWLTNDDQTLQVNHIDGNKLNNDSSNLEWVTARENRCHAVSNNKTSQFVGVAWRKDRNKWAATIYYNKRTQFLGYHDAEEEARQAYLTFLNDNNITNKYA